MDTLTPPASVGGVVFAFDSSCLDDCNTLIIN